MLWAEGWPGWPYCGILSYLSFAGREGGLAKGGLYGGLIPDGVFFS